MTVLIKVFPEAMFGIIGKDPSLTGRTDIWALLGQAIEKKFWLGYGYGVYWEDPLGPSYLVRQVLEWGVPSAHNGWIEIWLSCGVGIVIIFALHCLATLFFSLHSIKNGGREGLLGHFDYGVLYRIFHVRERDFATKQPVLDNVCGNVRQTLLIREVI